MLRSIGNNLNQITRRVNETGYIDNSLGNSFSDRELIMLMTQRFSELTQELSGLK